MWGLSGVGAIMGSLAKGKRLEHLELTEQPNMPFLYYLAVVSALVKHKWTKSKTWPALKARGGGGSPEGRSLRRAGRLRTDG